MWESLHLLPPIIILMQPFYSLGEVEHLTIHTWWVWGKAWTRFCPSMIMNKTMMMLVTKSKVVTIKILMKKIHTGGRLVGHTQSSPLTTGSPVQVYSVQVAFIPSLLPGKYWF